MSAEYVTRGLREEDGLTVLELMIVLVILSLIGVVASVQVVQFLDRGKTEVATIQLRQIDSALQMFQIDVRRLPTEQEGLSALLVQPDKLEGWRGPYLRSAEQLQDPWGKPVEFALLDGGAYRLTSRGSDKAEGGEGNAADISFP